MDKGVRDLEHRAEGIIAEPGSLIRGSVRSCSRPELMQDNWGPGARLLLGSVGVAAFLNYMRRPGILNSGTGLFGLALLARCARGTRLADEILDALRPSAGPRSGQRHQAEAPSQAQEQSEDMKRMPA